MVLLLLRSAYLKSRTFSIPWCASEDVHKKQGGSIAWTAGPNFQRDMPYHRTSCPVYKRGGVGYWEGLINAGGQGLALISMW